ncbi:MAG TPA: hypothetical protein VI076_03025 [Actinopolymorphaceae bacterium]
MNTLWVETFPELGRPLELPDTPEAFAGMLVGQRLGRVIAAALVTPSSDDRARRRVSILAATEPDWFAMHDEVWRRLRADAVEEAYVVIREDCACVRSRVERLGYEVAFRSWGANLELEDDADLEPYDAVIRSVSERGYRVGPVTPEYAPEAHRLFQRSRGDFPSTPVTEPDDYSLAEIEDAARAERIFGVFDGERLCALTIVRRRSPAKVETEVTLTDRDLRGRGLATAVKACSVATSWRAGARRFATGGAEANEASLKANLRLGYVLEPSWFTYARAVSGAP